MTGGHPDNPTSNAPPASPTSDVIATDTNASVTIGRGFMVEESNSFKSPEGSQVNHPLPQQSDDAPMSNRAHLNVGSSVLGFGDPVLKNSPLPPPPQPIRLMERPIVSKQMSGISRPTSAGRRSNIDWIVPVSEPEEKVRWTFPSFVTSN